MIPQHDLDMLRIDADKADFDDRTVLTELIDTYEDLEGESVQDLRNQIDLITEECNEWETERNAFAKALKSIVADPIRAVTLAKEALAKAE